MASMWMPKACYEAVAIAVAQFRAGRHLPFTHRPDDGTASAGCVFRRRLVRVGGTPWTRSRPERYRRQRRDPPPGLLRGGENAGLNPRTRRPEDRYRYERTMPLLAGLYGSRRKGTAPSSIGGAADPWLRGHSGGPRRCPLTIAEPANQSYRPATLSKPSIRIEHTAPLTVPAGA